MNYYLGYYTKNGFKKIDLSEFIDDSCNILNIVLFTTEFLDSDDLQDFLIKNGKLDKKRNLYYLIEKGKSPNKHLEEIPMGNKICYNKSKKFFDLQELRGYLKLNSNNQNLYTEMLNYSLKKYGLVGDIVNYIYDLAMNPINMRSFIYEIHVEKVPQVLKSIILKYKKYFEDNFGETINVNAIVQDNEYQSLVDTFTNLIKSDKDVCFYFYSLLKSKLTINTIPFISTLNILLSRINYNSKNQIELDNEVDDTYEYIERLYNQIVYRYDPKDKNFKTANGKRVISSRTIVDIGLFLVSYEHNLKINEKDLEEQNVDEIEDDNEDDMFLSREDFKGEDPDEYGYSINGSKCEYRGSR